MEVLQRLVEGNQRFRGGRSQAGGRKNLSELAAGQRPSAIVLSCADSRVPPEIVFDQGFGDLFVIRVAGNIAGPSQIGSIEYAVEQLGSRLIVVLGHSGCGAVTAAVEGASEGMSAELTSIVEAIDSAIQVDPAQDMDTQLAAAVRQNILSVVEQLKRNTIILPLLSSGELAVVGAEYSLETGVVDFYSDSSA